jgi:uncharacterized membrane protein YphA (DoxX/SURF4 family)
MKERLTATLNRYAQKSESILQVTLIGWIVTKCITTGLWSADRNFPTAPVWEGLRGIPPSVHLLLLAVSLLTMSALLFRPRRKALAATLLIIEALSCLMDQNRLQPWEYQFIFLLFIQLTAKPDTVQSVYLILLSGLYTYSGLHKLNPDFLQVVWKDMILNRYLQTDPSLSRKMLVDIFGYAIPLIELAAGLGLLAGERIRQQALSVLITMHLVILIILGPLGINHNQSVWPWNLVMMGSLLLLKQGIGQSSNRNERMSAPAYIVWACWFFLPALSFVGLWDQYLSGNLYSGKLPRLSICISDSSQARDMRKFFAPEPTRIGCRGEAAINVQQWALREIGVPPYPEKRAYRATEDWWKKQFPRSGGVLIYYPSTHPDEAKKFTFTP